MHGNEMEYEMSPLSHLLPRGLPLAPEQDSFLAKPPRFFNKKDCLGRYVGVRKVRFFAAFRGVGKPPPIQAARLPVLG